MSNTSRRLDTKLIDFLTSMAQKPSLPPATRHQATYIIASYHKHRNVYRLMAHISALSNGEMVINISHGVKSMAEDKDSPVYHLGTYLQDLMADLRISPTIPDFEGHPIELYSVLDSVTRSLISGEQEFELHRALLSMEKRANEHLAHLTKKYDYHFIFRVGLQQYYMTRTVAEKINFWRHDPRSLNDRLRTQQLCYDAFERQLRLNEAEKMVLIQVTNCSARDAKFFWNWLEGNRVAYFAMQSCISLLDKIGDGDVKVVN